MIRFGCVLLLFAALVGAFPAYATTVAIVSPPRPSAEAAETVSRVHGELLSVGLGVVLSERTVERGADGTDSRAWLQDLIADDKASAVIDVVDDVDVIAVDVWVGKSSPGRFEVTRVSVERNATNASERLALRAIEALRGSLLEIDVAARARRRDATPPPVVVASPKTEPPALDELRKRYVLELGIAAVASLDGVGPAVAPTVLVGWAPRPWLLVDAAFAGFGSRARVTTAAGSALVGQGFAVLGSQARFRPSHRWSPTVAVSAGVLRTSVEGQDGANTEAHAVERWSLLVDASAGIAFRLYGRYYATVAAHVQMAEPYVVVHVVDIVGASVGRPNVLLRLSLGAWL